MKAEFVDGSMMNSDLGIVNAARVSLGKHHETFVDPDDRNLIQFLARNNHISPFFHPRLYFFTWWGDEPRIKFYENANLSGFSWINDSHAPRKYWLRGSLYGFIHNIEHLPKLAYYMIFESIKERFPCSFDAFVKDYKFAHLAQIHFDYVEEDEIAQLALDNPDFYKLLSATLRVKLPIFIARQVRTSKIGFAYSDLYVESESFDYNEVSRRYVNDEPEFYYIKEWRVREGGKVKQGSTGIADAILNEDCIYNQSARLHDAICSYDWSNNNLIAPEQSRAILPQSMYTEWYQTGTLHRWAQWLQLRLDPHVQQETRECAEMVRDCLKARFSHWAEVYKF